MKNSFNNTKINEDELQPNADSLEQLLEQFHDPDKFPNQPSFNNKYDYWKCKKLFSEGKDVSKYLSKY